MLEEHLEVEGETQEAELKYKPSKGMMCSIITLSILFFLQMLIIFAMAVMRAVSLTVHMSWFKEHESSFPTACPDWANEIGCTRVTLDQNDCVNVGNIPEQRQIIFEFSGEDEFKRGPERQLYMRIEECVYDLAGAKFMGEKGLKNIKQNGDSLHFSFNDAFWGFIQDIYIHPTVYYDTLDLDQKVQYQLKI